MLLCIKKKLKINQTLMESLFLICCWWRLFSFKNWFSMLRSRLRDGFVCFLSQYIESTSQLDFFLSRSNLPNWFGWGVRANRKNRRKTANAQNVHPAIVASLKKVFFFHPRSLSQKYNNIITYNTYEKFLFGLPVFLITLVFFTLFYIYKQWHLA